MGYYEKIVAITKAASSPTEYEIGLLSENIYRKIRTAASRGESGVVINTSSDYFRSPSQGGKMVRSSALESALTAALNDVLEEGFTVTKQGDWRVEISWD